MKGKYQKAVSNKYPIDGLYSFIHLNFMKIYGYQWRNYMYSRGLCPPQAPPHHSEFKKKKRSQFRFNLFASEAV